MDQDAVLTALTNWNGPPLPLYIFPPHLVQNGWQVNKPPTSEPNLKTHFFFSSSFAGYSASYFTTDILFYVCASHHLQVGVAAGELPIIVHNNWADGDKGTHIQKMCEKPKTLIPNRVK